MKDLCERCGRCCLIKESWGWLWITTGEYCPQYKGLDKGKGFCKIYGKHTHTRIGNEGICLSVEQMIVARLLPDDCPYTQNLPHYSTLVVNYEDRKEKA